MSQEDLSAGFNNLMVVQQREEQFLKNVAECVHYNSELLNALVTRVNAAEANATLANKKAEDQDSQITKLTDDVRKALEYIETVDAEKDNTLRKELNAMAITVEKGHDELQEKIAKAEAKIAQVEAIVAASQPVTGPPQTMGMPEREIRAAFSQSLSQMQSSVDNMGTDANMLLKGSEQTTSRLSDLEMNAKFHASGVQEMHNGMTALRVEMEQLVNQVNTMRATRPTGGTTIGTATTGATARTFDPWQGQTFGQQTRPQPTTHDIGSPPRQHESGHQPSGKWRIYDEKFILMPALDKHRYDDRKPLEWLQSIRDYVAG